MSIKEWWRSCSVQLYPEVKHGKAGQLKSAPSYRDKDFGEFADYFGGFELATIKYAFLNEQNEVVLEDTTFFDFSELIYMKSKSVSRVAFLMNTPQKSGAYTLRLLLDNTNVMPAFYSYNFPYDKKDYVVFFLKRELLLKNIVVK